MGPSVNEDAAGTRTLVKPTLSARRGLRASSGRRGGGAHALQADSVSSDMRISSAVTVATPAVANPTAAP